MKTRTKDSAATRDFAAVIKTLRRQRGVELGRMFGSDGLKVAGKVFALEVKGALVVKLSPERARALTQQGLATSFDPGHGRVMKQWIAVSPASSLDWLALSKEAMTLVAERSEV